MKKICPECGAWLIWDPMLKDWICPRECEVKR